jgi:hypothetical protein
MATFVCNSLESQGGLSAHPVLAGDVDSDCLEDFGPLTAQNSENAPMAADDDETEALVRDGHRAERFNVEAVVADVFTTAERDERFDFEANLLFPLSVVPDQTTEHAEAVGRNSAQSAQLILSRL